MMNRREMLAASASVLTAPLLRGDPTSTGAVVNDMQAQLNETRVARIEQPKTINAVAALMHQAKKESKSVSICGGRHSQGGQQFGTDTILIDSRGLDNVVSFDREKGLITVEAGIRWPNLIDYLRKEAQGHSKAWTIRQKQTGVDQVTVGGSLSSNIHGRGLKYPPFVGDIESFDMIDARGEVRHCSRKENTELFSLAIGGYGNFGVIGRVTLRLVPWGKVERTVKIIEVRDLLPSVESRINEGYLFGDCQYQTNITADGPPIKGVFSCYRPVPDNTPVKENQRKLSGSDWARLYNLGRTDKPKAFETYANYYMSTSGQVYYNDEQQMSGNFQGYRAGMMALETRGTEVISEAHVPRPAVMDFLVAARKCCVEHGLDITYGTIRFIAKDDETFLNWAKEPPVCVLCNLHVVHTEAGIKKAIDDFQHIFDLSIAHGGRYYLTYHRWARRDQVEKAYPQFVDFLKLKKKYDPQERIQSDWYRHYKEMFKDRL